MMKQSSILMLMILAFMAGIASTAVYLQARHIMRNFLRTEVRIDSAAVRQKCLDAGIELPARAWDIDFYRRSGGPDSQYYIAFSASPEDIARTLDDLKGKFGSEDQYIIRRAEPPRDSDGKPVEWWPDMSAGIEPHQGVFYWAGHDKTASRVYIYRHTI